MPEYGYGHIWFFLFKALATEKSSDREIYFLEKLTRIALLINIFHSQSSSQSRALLITKIYQLFCINWTVFLRTSVIAVNPETKDLLWVVYNMYFLKIDSPLFINLIHRYILSILCKTNFGHIYLSPTLNATSKNNRYKILSSKTWWEPKSWHHSQ